MQIMAMYSKRFVATKSGRLISRKRRSGTSSFKLLEVSRHCMIGRFCIEI
jgi:hypothetical protein